MCVYNVVLCHGHVTVTTVIWFHGVDENGTLRALLYAIYRVVDASLLLICDEANRVFAFGVADC